MVHSYISPHVHPLESKSIKSPALDTKPLYLLFISVGLCCLPWAFLFIGAPCAGASFDRPRIGARWSCMRLVYGKARADTCDIDICMKWRINNFMMSEYLRSRFRFSRAVLLMIHPQKSPKCSRQAPRVDGIKRSEQCCHHFGLDPSYHVDVTFSPQGSALYIPMLPTYLDTMFLLLLYQLRHR